MKQWKKVFGFVLAAVVLCGVVFGLTERVSLGATSDVIEIGTAEELRGIGIDADKPLSGDSVLTADIDLSDAEWIGIGRDTATALGSYFTGTIDG